MFHFLNLNGDVDPFTSFKVNWNHCLWLCDFALPVAGIACDMITHKKILLRLSMKVIGTHRIANLTNITSPRLLWHGKSVKYNHSYSALQSWSVNSVVISAKLQKFAFLTFGDNIPPVSPLSSFNKIESVYTLGI